MTRLAPRAAIISALVVVGALLVVLFVFVSRNRNSVIDHDGGPGPPPRLYLYAKVPIPKGTSGLAIGKMIRYSPEWVNGAVPVGNARGEVAIRTIPAGAPLTAADFGLPGPMYYPRGYPKHVPASQIPAEMTHQLPAQSFPSDLEVAPGVWVDGSPSEANLDVHVANGTLVGYCRSVRAFQAHNPQIPFATKCWPR
jgi:hypothetical protein